VLERLGVPKAQLAHLTRAERAGKGHVRLYFDDTLERNAIVRSARALLQPYNAQITPPSARATDGVYVDDDLTPVQQRQKAARAPTFAHIRTLQSAGQLGAQTSFPVVGVRWEGAALKVKLAGSGRWAEHRGPWVHSGVGAAAVVREELPNPDNLPRRQRSGE
jgi:hypothetical protein